MIRLDKFLKLTRLVKRRTVAAEMADAGAVRVNGRPVKPSAQVKAGDTLEVAFPFRVVAAEVLLDDEAMLRRPKAEGARILGERRVNPEDDPWQGEEER